jgi:hypothetical protein
MATEPRFKPGAKVTNVHRLEMPSYRNAAWEKFNDRGMMRNVHTNELCHRYKVKDLTIYGDRFEPGTLKGVIEYIDELSLPEVERYGVTWRDPEGRLIGYYFANHNGWYAPEDLKELDS